MKLTIQIIDRINRIVEGVVALLLFASFFATFFQVIMRNLIKISVPWTDEFSRYCIIYVVYLASGIAARRGKLIRMDVVPMLMKFSEKQTQILYWIADVLSIAFTVIVIISAAKIIPLNMRKMSASLHVPMAYFYYALPVGAVWLIVNMFTCSLEETLKLKEAAKKEVEQA